MYMYVYTKIMCVYMHTHSLSLTHNIYTYIVRVYTQETSP